MIFYIDVNFLKIVQDARKINESMPDHVVELLEDAFSESKKSIYIFELGNLFFTDSINDVDKTISPIELILIIRIFFITLLD